MLSCYRTRPRGGANHKRVEKLFPSSTITPTLTIVCFITLAARRKPSGVFVRLSNTPDGSRRAATSHAEFAATSPAESAYGADFL